MARMQHLVLYFYLLLLTARKARWLGQEISLGGEKEASSDAKLKIRTAMGYCVEYLDLKDFIYYVIAKCSQQNASVSEPYKWFSDPPRLTLQEGQQIWH